MPFFGGGRFPAVHRAAVMLLGIGAASPALAGDFGCGGTCNFTNLGAAEAVCANVLVKPGTYTLVNVVTWSGTSSVAVGDSTCTSAAAGSATFNAAAGKRAFVVNAGDSLTMTGISLTGGAPASGNGGGDIVVQTAATLVMNGGTLSNGTATAASGGCLAGAPDSVITLDNVTISGCTADNEGGGISIQDGGTLLLTDTVVTDNVASAGGGIRAVGANVDIEGASEISYNAASQGAGVYIVGTSSPTTLEFREAFGNSPAIVYNDASNFGGGLLLTGATGPATVVTYDATYFGQNSAVTGAGILMQSVPGHAELVMHDDSSLVNNGDDGGTTIGGGLYVSGGEAFLLDDVRVDVNYASQKGGGMYVAEPGTVTIAGSPCTAPDGFLSFAPRVAGGVHIDGNGSIGSSPVEGAAIYVEGGIVVADYLSVEGNGNTTASPLPEAVVLRNGAIFQANRSHFISNDNVFVVESASSLTVEAAYNDLGCDTDGGALSSVEFGFNRYCSEISNNKGRLIELSGAGSNALIRTTGMLENALETTDVAVVVGDGTTLDFTTVMVGDNSTLVPSTPMIVEVQDGGDFVAKQNTFADLDMPVVYQAGATGDFRRNAAFDAGAGVAVEVDALAVVTGNENIGDWSGSISPASLNGTAPGFVTDLARGNFHLALTSAAVDICTIDGGFDVEGRVRPQPAGLWDAGAIEVDQ